MPPGQVPMMPQYGAPPMGGPPMGGPPPYGAMPPPGCGPPPGYPGGPPPGPGGPDAGEHGSSEDKDREISRLNRELRKAEDRISFFRNQVLSMQEQLTAMDKPLTATVHASDVERLKTELAEERARSQALQASFQNAQRNNEFRATSSGHGSSGCEAATITALQLRVRELERERGQGSHGGSAHQHSNHAHSGGHAGGAGLPPQPQQPAPPPSLGNAGGPGMALDRHHSGHGGPSPYEPSLSQSHAHVSAGGVGMSPSRGLSHPNNGGGFSSGDPLDPVENPGGATRAVIVGCDYPGQLGALRAGVADAQQWARFFMKRCNFTEADIRLLSDDPSHYQQKDRAESAVASRDTVMRALRWLTARSSPGDQLFFVFCGHGTQVIVDDYAGQKMCESALVPTDIRADSSQPRIISDTDVHKALLGVPQGVQVNLIYDSCHAGQPIDRDGLSYLQPHVNRGRVDYEKLKGHPVLPRFLELQQLSTCWREAPEAVTSSLPRCQAVQWAACSNDQFCVELPIDERPRGVFTYIFISALLKVGVHAPSEALLREMQNLTQQLQGKWRLQQDVRMDHGRGTSGQQQFLRGR